MRFIHFKCSVEQINNKKFAAPFAAGILADKIGRKWTLLSSTVFFVVAYIMLLFASEVSVMFVARLLQVLFFVEIIISELELNPIISRVSAQDL